MKNKGLSVNTRPQQQPDGTYRYAKNGVMDERGVHRNEPGFIKLTTSAPYGFIGAITTPKYPVIISTNNTNSAIGYLNTDTDTYVPILNDASLPFKLPFSSAMPVIGESQLNYKGEVVVVLRGTDGLLLYVNCDNPVATTLDDLRFFPLFKTGTTAVTSENGGSLLPGAYYIGFRYVRNDGTETACTGLAGPFIITGTPGNSSGKAFRIELSDLDTTYDRVQLIIVAKIEGVFSTQSLVREADIASSGKAVIVYTGTEPSNTELLEEVLLPPVRYKSVNSIGQLNDALYIGDVKTDPEINMQPYVNLIQVRWKSELINANPVPQEVLEGKKKSFMHREVYALYIHFSKTGGGWTSFFPLIGPEAAAGDLLNSALAATQGITAKVFQVEDTITSFSGNKGKCGVWLNADETYPDDPSFDSTALGGTNLRNTPVRHFRMPSIGWCKDNLYSGEPEYGKTKLDLLGIEISNVVIPSELSTVLDGGYRIAYARRSTQNSTIVGQGLFLQGARASSSSSGLPDSADNNYVSTGGNWGAMIDYDGSGREKPLRVDPSLFRFHSFDLLFNNPSITPAFIATELKLRRTNIPYSGGLIEDYSVPPGSRNGPIMYLIDYSEKGLSPIRSASDKRIRKITESRYVPANLVVGKWKNLQLESVYAGKLSGTALMDPSDLSEHVEWTGPVTQRKDKAVQFEYTYLTNLMNLPTNLYLPQNSQSLVFAGNRQSGIGTFWGGDVFICDYSFHTYGWHDSNNADYGLDADNAPLGGIRTARRFVCESISNINARYETIGNIYSKWYPAFPLIPDDVSNYMLFFDRSYDPNQFGYNNDLNSVADLNPYNIFDVNKEQVTEFPFRIHRTGKLSKQTKIRSWKTILPLDYYEMPKTFGRIVNIVGDQDKLLIHCMYALLVTRDKAKLESGNLSIVLGAGDIFQFEPQEAHKSKLGYAGTQHQISCVYTPVGYIFISDELKQIFIWTNGQLKLLNEDMDLFFREYLQNKEDNPFVGNGYTIGYDQYFKRVLVTMKKESLPSTVKQNFVLTAATVGSLTAGDIIYMHGRYVRFKGVNDTIYNCTANVVPTVSNITVSMAEDVAMSSLITDFTGISNYNNLTILSDPDTVATIAVESGAYKLRLARLLDYEQDTTHVITIKATSIDNIEATFTVTINVTNVVEPPVGGGLVFEVNENSINGTVVGSCATAGATSYSITAGNNGATFLINPTTGQLSVNSNTILNYELYPVFNLTVLATNGAGSTELAVTVNVLNVNEPPVLVNETINVLETVAINSEVYALDVVDPENGVLTFEIVSATTPGIFDIGALTGKVTCSAALNAATVPQHILVIRGYDPEGNFGEMTLTINVLFNPMNITFNPFGNFCALTTKNWLYIQVKNSGTLVATLNNVAGQTWQGMSVPYYSPVANHIDCGGTTTVYYSVTKFDTVTKNDCVEGVGSAVTYVVPAGSYWSVIDQANADGAAEADVAANKQAFANTNGYCIR